MIKTIRGKIIVGIVFISIVVQILINLITWNVFQNNLKKYIIDDMDKIKSITFSEISKHYNLEAAIRNNKGKVLPILNDINEQYSVYISIDYHENDNIAFTGAIINEIDKKKILLESNEKASILYIHSEERTFFATYTYPIYDESNYIGTLVLQKSYFDQYTNNRLLMIKIVLVQCVLYILMLLIINNWLKKTMTSFKKLAKGMNTVGEGDFTKRLEVKGKDEVANLVNYFNSMQERILCQIQQLQQEKIKTEKLERANKEFFNCATHEMRTPLTAISGYTQLLQKNTLDKEDIDRAYERIAVESERLSNMVENMLILARGKEKLLHEPVYFDVKKLLMDVIQEFEFASEKEKIKLQVNSDKVIVFAAEEDIRKVFVNLIDNAIKYSQDNKIQVTYEYNEKAVIAIENKCGQIPEEIKEKLFDPFTKYNYGDNKQVSSGLGLLICRELIEKNKGNIEYRIDNGKICFKIELYK